MLGDLVSRFGGTAIAGYAAAGASNGGLAVGTRCPRVPPANGSRAR
jgi:hypothetical protein